MMPPDESDGHELASLIYRVKLAIENSGSKSREKLITAISSSLTLALLIGSKVPVYNLFASWKAEGGGAVLFEWLIA